MACYLASTCSDRTKASHSQWPMFWLLMRPKLNRKPLKVKPPPRNQDRINTTQTIVSIPALRWPKEGFYGWQGEKRATYDALSIPEWAVGQLINIFHMQNPDTIKMAWLQTILTLKDATSLPWPAVREAYGTSMHGVELGNLSWGDQM